MFDPVWQREIDVGAQREDHSGGEIDNPVLGGQCWVTGMEQISSVFFLSSYKSTVYPLILCSFKNYCL